MYIRYLINEFKKFTVYLKKYEKCKKNEEKLYQTYCKNSMVQKWPYNLAEFTKSTVHYSA